MYAYSKNYSRLYQLLCAGEVAIAMVDYRIRPNSTSGNDVISRDVCQIVREKEWDIQFFVRGTGYGRVQHTPWLHPQLTEAEMFIRQCEDLHFEFVCGAAPNGRILKSIKT